ncbi:ABC transporter permease subunit [Streptomyces sp. 3MP-14]|uniref:ABC transporter permease subunit n=1 Tax=Streptomyces mimosae TaxID=2586635 RepID=A0A5N6A777_9ACTN|nr:MULTISPECIES: sugar ABC transporter permease [Streptomyces]KAB8164511.1 ABC transporter permease subunit [Streptomyces mimosae]KAB8175427.1 ABC transporter permease subunit [Streptomyces sp. 3MP-14]
MRPRTFFALSGPAIALMAALLIAPLIATLTWSFQNVPVGQSGTFVGLDNYRQLLTSPRFGRAAAFTVAFALVITFLKLVFGYLLAVLLTKVRRGRAIFLGLLLSTYVVPTVVGALDFSWLFNDVFGGPFNRLLEVFGIHIDWLVSEWPARTLVAMHMLWHEIPFAVLILFAGLQALSKEPLEAAELDGANWWQRQRYVVIPSLGRLISFVCVIGIMDALKIFDSIRIITPAASQLGTESLMTYVYQIALNDSYRLGIGSAVNVLTIILTLVLLAPFLRSTWRDARGK